MAIIVVILVSIILDDSIPSGKKLVGKIKEIIRIERKEESHHLFEDADFSVDTVKKLIQNREREASKILPNFGKN
jgi:hypothetical protein